MNVYKVEERPVKLNLLIYGQPGCGKTTLAATAMEHPELAPALLLNIEGGTLSVVGTGLDAVDVHSLQQLEQVLWALSNPEDKQFGQYRTVIIDSGTELQTITLQELVMAASKKDRGRSPDDIQLQDYGRNTNALRRVFRWFRDLPVHVVVTALAKEVYPPNVTAQQRPFVEPSEVFPLFTEKLGQSVSGYFDAVWYQYVRDGQRFLLTQRTQRFFAKTRGARFSAALGNVVPVRDLTQTEGEGHTLASIYQTLIDTEIAHDHQG